MSTPAQSPAFATEIMQTGGRTTQPIGHYEYCQKNIADCSILSFSTRPTRLTRERWTQMVETNAFANNTVTPVTDQEYYGVEELWSFPEAYGDCEDYVLLKRDLLIKKGWPASSLLITVVRQQNGDGHAVLTVRTDLGDFILDNLNERIETWTNTEYTYLKRVSAKHSGVWEDILDTRQMVGSVSSVK